jgi:hypothetical protein
LVADRPGSKEEEMTIETLIHTRLAVTVVCVLAVAAFASPAAFADPPQGHRAPPTDVVDRYLANDRAHARQPIRKPDVIERYVESRVGIANRTPDGYQPQLRRGETQALSASTASADGFGWLDAGIGAAFGFALGLIALGSVFATRQQIAHS